jgi:hypothetical protein
MTALARVNSKCKRMTRTRQRGRLTPTNPQLSDSNKNLAFWPQIWDLKLRQTGRLTVGRNITLTLIFRRHRHFWPGSRERELIWSMNQMRDSRQPARTGAVQHKIRSILLEAVTRRLVNNWEDLKCVIVNFIECELVKLL